MRILMLGNSLTTSHNMPDRLAQLLDAEVVVHARGGARLAEHLNPNTRMGAATQRALAEKSWDYVVMQEMSNAAFTTSDAFIDRLVELSWQVRAAGAEPVLYATWAYAPWCRKLEKYMCHSEEMFDVMDGCYVEAGIASGAHMADVCRAFRDHPSPGKLYADDGVHPSEAGAELAARTIARTIMRLEERK